MTTTKEKIELAKSIFGNKTQKLNQNVSYITAKATSDSVDGKVYVKFDDDEEPIELVTLESVKENDIVQCILVGTEATVLGVVGRGDDVQRQIGDIGTTSNYFWYWTEEDRPGHSGTYISTVPKEEWTENATYLKAVNNAIELHDAGELVATFDRYEVVLASGLFNFKNEVIDGVLYNRILSMGADLLLATDYFNERWGNIRLEAYNGNISAGTKGGIIDIKTIDNTEYGNGKINLLSDGDITILAGVNHAGQTHPIGGNANIDRRGARLFFIQNTSTTQYASHPGGWSILHNGQWNENDLYNDSNMCPVQTTADGGFRLTAKGIYKLKIHTNATKNSTTAGAYIICWCTSATGEGEYASHRGWIGNSDLSSNDNEFIVKGDGTSTFYPFISFPSPLTSGGNVRTHSNFTTVQIEYLGTWQ